jgi:hypothetical protein
MRLRRLRMKSLRVQPLNLNERPSQKRARSITTTEATIVWSPHWGLFTALTVGVFVFLLRMPITSRMAGIAIEARRIAANVAKLSVLVRCLLLAQSGRVDRAGKRSA